MAYVSDQSAGIRRAGKPGRFRYLGPDAQPLDENARARITALAIPPAWTDVWIAPTPRGHIQATGRDARGRKQYRYHPAWTRRRGAEKYLRVLDFARALPAIREATEADLRRHGLPRRKVLATVVRMLELTLIRVGNAEYASSNGSFGLTTLRDWHVDFAGAEIRFHFRGKGGKEYRTGLRNRRLARIVRQCQELPGQTLFQYVDDEGQPQSLDSSDVNDYLREVTGEDFTAKDFRTWAGTVLAARALTNMEDFNSESQARSNIVAAISETAAQLGNTPAVCRTHYVHPAVFEAYTAKALLKALTPNKRRPHDGAGLTEEERCVLAFLTAIAGGKDAAPCTTGSTGAKLSKPRRGAAKAG